MSTFLALLSSYMRWISRSLPHVQLCKMLGANVLPLPAQLSSRSATTSPTDLNFTGTPSLTDTISNFLPSRSARRQTVCFESFYSREETFPKQSRRDSLLRKLAGPRENAKRFLRLRSSGVQAPAQRLTPRSIRPVSEIIFSPSPTSVDLDADMRSESSSMTEVMPRTVSDQDVSSPDLTTPFTPLQNEKIVATGSGIAVGIALTEPVLYLQGYDQHDPSSKKSAILRGQLHLKVTKCIKIKKISICFRGHAQTDWPDGMSHDPGTRHQ